MNSVRNYTTKQIIDRIKSLKSFKEIPKGYFIVGVRSNEDTSNRYDDKFYIFKDESFLQVISGTTNPGLSVLKRGYLKYNKLGAAIVKSDEWYYDVWAYGLHNGKMPALKQVEPMLIYRDGDDDWESEESGTVYKGLFGINFHTNSYDLDTKLISVSIGGWSAGCQVIDNVAEYKKVIELIKGQRRISYVLLDEWAPDLDK